MNSLVSERLLNILVTSSSPVVTNSNFNKLNILKFQIELIFYEFIIVNHFQWHCKTSSSNKLEILQNRHCKKRVGENMARKKFRAVYGNVLLVDDCHLIANIAKIKTQRNFRRLRLYTCTIATIRGGSPA